MRLVQLQSSSEGRRLAVVAEPHLRFVKGYVSVHDAAAAAIELSMPLVDLIQKAGEYGSLSYDNVYNGESEWKLLPAVDHPTEAARCIVSGTGLTHRKSAANRNAMHQTQHSADSAPPLTDSMKIYQWGAEGGRPEPGRIGVQPEWFYKGNGTILRAHGEPLETPAFAEDGGEEPEIAGIYIVGRNGTPYRIGFAAGNEFSDHQMERRNYLYLAPSKLRTCAIGPEMALGESFRDVHGVVRVERGGETLWSQAIDTGEQNMVHSLANLEHHHFKYPLHRRPGDIHVHFFGADAFSFGDGVALEDGDRMEVAWTGMGRPLRNPIRIDGTAPDLVKVESL